MCRNALGIPHKASRPEHKHCTKTLCGARFFPKPAHACGYYNKRTFKCSRHKVRILQISRAFRLCTYALKCSVVFRAGGFAAQNHANDNSHSRNVIQKALNKTFAPEFLNRLDEIITFDQLSLDAITRIVDIELKALTNRIEQMGYMLNVNESAKHFLATKGYDVQFGARPLKRAIQNYLEDGIASLMVSGEVCPGDTINVTALEGASELEIRKG